MSGLPEGIYSLLICCPESADNSAVVDRQRRGACAGFLNFVNCQSSDRGFVLQSGADGIERIDVRGHLADQ